MADTTGMERRYVTLIRETLVGVNTQFPEGCLRMTKDSCPPKARSQKEDVVKDLKGINPRLARRIAKHRDEFDELLVGDSSDSHK